jgi:hypothetical protein
MWSLLFPMSNPREVISKYKNSKSHINKFNFDMINDIKTKSSVNAKKEATKRTYNRRFKC